LSHVGLQLSVGVGISTRETSIMQQYLENVYLPQRHGPILRLYKEQLFVGLSGSLKSIIRF
jgi:hypothetical protein